MGDDHAKGQEDPRALPRAIESELLLLLAQAAAFRWYPIHDAKPP